MIHGQCSLGRSLLKCALFSLRGAAEVIVAGDEKPLLDGVVSASLRRRTIVAVIGMRTFLLKDVGLAATWLVTAAFTGTVTLACSSDPASEDKSTSAGPTSNNTITSGAPTTTTTGGAGPTTTGGAGPTTTGGAGPTTTGGQNTTSAGGPTTGANNTTTTGAGGASTTAGTTGVVGSCGLTVDSYELSPAIA